LPDNAGLGLNAFYIALLTLMCGFIGATIVNSVVDSALGYATTDLGPRLAPGRSRGSRWPATPEKRATRWRSYDSGSGLKHRAVHETRTIPPPELVRLLRSHIKRYGGTWGRRRWIHVARVRRCALRSAVRHREEPLDISSSKGNYR
jgi:hypothetical protein